MLGADIFILVFVVLLIAFVVSAVKVVPQGFNFTVERLGKYIRTLKPGLGIIVPFIDRIGRKMNVMEQFLDVPSQEVITKDNATVTVDGVTFFQVLDAARASYEVSELNASILNLTMTNIRTVMGSMDLDELLSNRDEINSRLLNVVDAATEPWGVKVTRVEIKDINPPRDLVDSMARQMKAERDRRAVILEAEGERQAEVLKSEGEKRALVLEAEGRREAAFRDAEARERLAEAEAKATTMVSDAITTGERLAINYFVAEKYVKALESLASAPNQKVLMLPLEATSVLGSLGGIGEIFKETFGPDKPGPQGGSQPQRTQPNQARNQATSQQQSQQQQRSPSSPTVPSISALSDNLAGASSAGLSTAGMGSMGDSSAGESSAGDSSAGTGSAGVGSAGAASNDETR
jgi:regulator of protease activity HflC (stomatin/prohibitin superfamily)